MDSNVIDHAPPGHNVRPQTLDEKIDTALAEWKADFAEREAQAGRAKVTNDDEAARAATLCTILSTIGKAADARREAMKEPYLNGGRKIDAAFKAFLADVEFTRKAVLALINTYRLAQEKAASAERDRLAREAATAAAKAAEAAAAGNLLAAARLEQQAEVKTAEAQVATPTPIRSSYGGLASGRAVWKFEVTNRAALPDSVTSHPKVIEAIDAVIAGLIRGGTREIAGCRIYSESTTVVRG